MYLFEGVGISNLCSVQSVPIPGGVQEGGGVAFGNTVSGHGGEGEDWAWGSWGSFPTSTILIP